MTATRVLRNALHTFSLTFSPLSIRNIRLYLGGQTISLVGTWMQSTAQAWVVWQISHSTVDLGVNAMLSLLPFLVLGPWIGSVADRFDRRRLLIATQTVSMILAAILALLVQSQTVQLWHVDLLALLLGIVNTLDLPSQQTFIGDLSGKQKLREAVVLNAMIWQVSRMVGPALAGWVIGILGVALTFWLNALSFIPVIASLALVKTDPQPQARPATALNDFRQAVRFIAAEPRVQDMLIFTGLAATLALSIVQILPAFASDVLHGGPDTLGTLLGASGAGALIGTFVVIPLAQKLPRTGMTLGLSLIWTGFWFAIFALTTTPLLADAAIALSGMGIVVVITIPMSLLQLMTPSEMRARVLSIRMTLSFGLVPIASLAIGITAQLLGTPNAILVNGTLLALGSAGLLALRPGLRAWQSAGPATSQTPGQSEPRVSPPVAAALDA